MRLLIATQVVDPTDPILGFFHRWIEELAAHTEYLEVVCLRAGAYHLPSHVRVCILPKGRLRRAWALLRVSYARRREYDKVLVHMNPEYVLAAAWLWKLLGKTVAMWYAHGGVDLKLRLAARLVDLILTSSEEGFRIASPKVRILGQGIDTELFSSGGEGRGKEILSVGRLSRTKRHDLVIESASYFPHEVWIAGDGPERANLEELAAHRKVSTRVHFLGNRTQAQLRELYRRAGVFAHFSETGSMDKVVLEALLCGLPVVSSSEAYRSLLEPYGLFVEEPVPQKCASVLEASLGKDVGPLTEQVRRAHSLQGLVPRMLAAIAHP